MQVEQQNFGEVLHCSWREAARCTTLKREEGSSVKQNTLNSPVDHIPRLLGQRSCIGQLITFVVLEVWLLTCQANALSLSYILSHPNTPFCRQGFSMQSWLAWNSYIRGSLKLVKILLLYFPSAGIQECVTIASLLFKLFETEPLQVAQVGLTFELPVSVS